MRIHIWMVNLCSELELRWLEWVVLRECNAQIEISVLEWRLCWTLNSCLPFEWVVLVQWSTYNALSRRFVDVLKLFQYSSNSGHDEYFSFLNQFIKVK